MRALRTAHGARAKTLPTSEVNTSYRKMASHIQPAVTMFNIFAKELILIAKKHCSSEVKACLKKRYKLFDASSPVHVQSFLKRRNAEKVIDYEVQVFEGISRSALIESSPADIHSTIKGVSAAMGLAAFLFDADSSEELMSKIALALVTKDPSVVEGDIIDDDLWNALKVAVQADLHCRATDELQKLARPRTTLATDTASNNSVGIVGLAEEISRELDLSSLMSATGAHGSEPGLATIIGKINEQVQKRIKDGQVDPDRLCSEAQAILGTMPSSSG